MTLFNKNVRRRSGPTHQIATTWTVRDCCTVIGELVMCFTSVNWQTQNTDQQGRCVSVCVSTHTAVLMDWHNASLNTNVVHFILWVLWSLLIPAIWLCHHLLCGIVSVRLLVSLVGTSRLSGSWSAAGHNHSKMIGQDPICANLHDSDHVWRGRSKASCRLVGSVTID